LGYIHYWVNEKNALNEITIPEGCGGTAGFNPDGNEGDEVIPEPESFSMRYCFEDNFPTPGDYDFNDVVLTVTPTLNDKTLTIKVSLDAVGGTETIAAAMRLVGVNSSDLVSYTVTKAFPSIDEMSWGATYHNIEHRDGFVKEDENPNNTNNMVIVLFKDAHWAINPENDNSGGPKRVFYNTVEPGDFYTNNVPPTTAIYTLVFNDEDKAKSMLAKNLYDVFIVEPYNGSYWEVHTVENGFKTLQVITPTKPEGYSQAYGDNMPWAIMVSGDFKYPYEWKSITNAYKEPGHSFAEWAENSSTANDWYDHPTSGLVYE
jgi:LruC domain-containing protein